MTISFSGLASGLDTSSWIKSLTALKQAKVTVLEEEKEQVLLSQDTLNSIKTFFNSFRSTIEKITDSRFNIPTMDLFAQNLAISANLDVLTATATHEAVEGKYEVKVDKLATNTNAVSGFKYTTTITETTMATLDSKLVDLGARAGNILVNVKSAGGIQRGVQIAENETIGTFITKLEGIGVSAHFNETTGIFSIDVGANDIDDIGNTNIVSALHLTGVNEGYKSNTLEVKKVETVFELADEETELGQLGVTNGKITIESNDVAYDIDLSTGDSLGELLTALRTNGIEASLVDGRFTIENAKITYDNANFVSSLGLSEETAERSQVSNNLTYQTTVVEVTEAGLSTKLSDLGTGTVVNAGDTVIVKNSNNEYHTITLGAASTLGDLMTGLSNAGLSAEVKHDGTIEITGGTITGGTFNAIEALGLNSDPYTAYVTGKALTETIETFELVTLDTYLVEDLGVREGYLEVTDSEGNKQYLKIYSGQTIQNLMADLASFGIDAELEEDTGTLKITGGAFATLEDGYVNTLISTGTIVETDSRYKKGTNLLTLLYGQPAINLNQTEVAQTYARSRALYQQVTDVVIATEGSTLAALDAMDGYTDLPTGDSNAIFNVRGVMVTVAVSDTMTVGELVNAINAAGIEAEYDSLTGLLTVNNATIESCPLAGVLNMETSIAGKYVTSDAVFATQTVVINATETTTLGYLGLADGVTETIKIYDAEDNWVNADFNVNSESTIGDIINAINSSGSGAHAYIENGKLKIENGKIENTAIEELLGLEKTFTGVSHVLGTSLTIETTYSITGESKLGNIIETMGTENFVQGGYTLTFNGQSMTVGENTTVNEIINQVYDLGGTAQVDAAGLLHINGGVLEGTVAQALGFSSVTVTLGVAATGNTMTTDTTVSADGNTTFEDLGFNADSTVVVHDSLNNAVATITMSKTETLDEFFAKLNAQGIEASISDGIISLNSPKENYIMGQIADVLGIGVIENEEGVNTNQTSTTPLKQTITEIAKESDKLSDIISKLGTTSSVSGGYNLSFNGSALSVSGNSTLGQVMQQIKNKGGTAFIDSAGRLQVSGGTLTGTVASALGIQSKTVTLGVSATGESLKTTEVVYADQHTTFAQLGFTGAATTIVYDNDGNSTYTITMQTTNTLNDFFNALKNQGINATISNGIISLDSDVGKYISGGDINTRLNIGVSSDSGVVNTSQSSTAAITHTIETIANRDTKLSTVINKLGTTSAVSGGYNLTFKDQTVTVSASTTLGQLIDQINNLGGIAELDHEGRLRVSEGILEGSVATALNMVSHTVPAGVSAAGHTLTVATTEKATTETKFQDILLGVSASTNLTMTVNDSLGTAIGTVTVKGSDSIGVLFDKLEAYGVNAQISDGIITITSTAMNSVVGDLANRLGISTFTTTAIQGMTQVSGAISADQTVTADLSTTLGELGLTGNPTISLHNSTMTSTTVGTFTEGSTINDVINWINNQVPNFVRFEDDGIVIDSSKQKQYFLSGGVAEKLGISIVEVPSSILDKTTSSTVKVTYTVPHVATLEDKLSDCLNEPVTDYRVTIFTNGTQSSVITTLSANSTIGNLVSALESAGIETTYDEASGTFTFNNNPEDNLNIVASGQILDSLGIETEVTPGSTATVGQTASSTIAMTYTYTELATEFTMLTELGLSGNYTMSVGSQSTTFGDFDTLSAVVTWLTSKGIDACMSNGYIEILDTNNTPITGNLADALGLSGTLGGGIREIDGVSSSNAQVSVTMPTLTTSVRDGQFMDSLSTLGLANQTIVVNGTTYKTANYSNYTLDSFMHLIGAENAKIVDNVLTFEVKSTASNAYYKSTSPINYVSGMSTSNTLGDYGINGDMVVDGAGTMIGSDKFISSFTKVDTSSLTELSSVTSVNQGQSYKISTVASWNKFVSIVETATGSLSGCTGVTFVLANDIDFGGASVRCLDDITFNGTFNGNGYALKNGTIHGANSDVGIFCSLDYATIKNLGLENITVGSSSEVTRVGVIAGYANYSTISNCYATGVINADMSDTAAGGLVGVANYTVIEKCWANVDNLSSLSYGGIVGNQLYGRIDQCYAFFDNNEAETIAGIALNASGNATIRSCYTGGDIALNYAITGSNTNVSLNGNKVASTVNYSLLGSCTVDSNNYYYDIINDVGNMTVAQFASQVGGANLTVDATGIRFNSNRNLVSDSFAKYTSYSFNMNTVTTTIVGTSTCTLDEHTTLNDLGLGQQTIVVGGTTYICQATEDIVDFFNSLDGKVTAYVQGGKIYLDTAAGCNISMSSDLAGALKLTRGSVTHDSKQLYATYEGVGWETSVTVYTETTQTANADTTFGELGILIANNTPILNGAVTIGTMFAASTLGDFVDLLNDYGAEATLENGMISIKNANIRLSANADFLAKLGLGSTGLRSLEPEGTTSATAITVTSPREIGLDTTMSDLGIANQIIYFNESVNAQEVGNNFISAVSASSTTGTAVSTVEYFTKGIVYTISTKEDLQKFASIVNSTTTVHRCANCGHVNTGYISQCPQCKTANFATNGSGAGCTFVLTADIDMSGVDWEPIGVDSTYSFQGTFNGNGHAIKNLTCNGGSGDSAGLFGYAKNATIKNVALVDARIIGDSDDTAVGGIVGAAYTLVTVSNCYTTGHLVNANDDSYAAIGGIVGAIYTGVIEKCWSNVSTDGGSFVGGIAGYMQSSGGIGFVKNEAYLDSGFGQNAKIAVGLGACLSNGMVNYTSCHVSATDDFDRTDLDYAFGVGAGNTSGTTVGANLNGAKSFGATTTTISSTVTTRIRDAIALKSTMTVRDLLGKLGATNIETIKNSNSNNETYLYFDVDPEKSIQMSGTGGINLSAANSSHGRYYIKSGWNSGNLTATNTLADLGITDAQNTEIVVRDTVTGRSYSSTISNLNTKLGECSWTGVSLTVNNGKVTLTPNEGYELVGMSTALANAFKMGSSFSVGSSNKLYVTTEEAVNKDITLENYGVTSSGSWTIIDNATGEVEDVFEYSKDDYFTKVVETLGDDYGFGIDFDANGKVTLTQNNGYHIACSDNDKLWDAMFGTGVNADDYHSVQITSTSSMVHNEQVIANIKKDLTTGSIFEELNTEFTREGQSQANVVVHNGATGAEVTITVNGTDSVGTLITALGVYGITARVDSNNKFVIDGSSNGSYIKSMDQKIIDALKLGEFEEEWSTTTYYNTSETPLYVSGNMPLFDESLLSTLTGYKPGSLIIHKDDGTNATVYLTNSDTISDFFNKIAEHGIEGKIYDGGKIALFGKGNTTIEDGDADFIKLFFTANGWEEYGQEFEMNTASNTLQTSTTSVPTGATALGDLNGLTFSNGSVAMIVNTKSSSGSYITMLQFTTSDTINNVIDKLAELGIEASIDTAGRFSVRSDSLTSFTMTSVLGQYLIGVNPQYVYNQGSVVNVSDALKDNMSDVEIDTNTVLGDFGVTNGSLKVQKADGSSVNITINNTKTLGDFFTQIAQYGLTGTVNNGKVSIIGAGDVYLEYSSGSNILSKLALSSVVKNNGEVKFNTNSSEQSETVTVTAVGTTQLKNLLNSSGTAPSGYSLVLTTKSNAGNETVTLSFSGTSTLNNVIDKLAEHGITAYIGTDGRLNFNSATLTDFSFSGNLGTYLNLANKKYNEVNTNSTSTNLSSTTDVSIDGGVVLSTLNVTNGALKVHKSDGTYATITVDRTKTLADFFTQIGQYGLNATIGDDGIISISGVGDVYLESATGGSNIISALGLAGVVRNTTVVTSNTNSDKQTDISTGSATGSTKLGDLNGISNYVLEISTDSNAGVVNATVTFSATDTLNDVIDKLAEYGINAFIGADGRVSMNGEDLKDFTIGGGLGEFLMGDYESTKVYDTVSTNSTSDNLQFTTNVSIDGKVVLDTLGVTNGALKIHKTDGTYATITIDNTKDLANFFTQIGQYGLNATIGDDGIISISGVGDVYLESVAGGSNIIDALGLAGVVRNTTVVTSNTNSDKQTDISTGSATGSTKLGDLNGISNYVLEISTDSNAGVENATVTFSATDTLNDVIDKLAEYGINAFIGADGRVSMNGEDLKDFTIGGGLGEFLMGDYESTKVYDTVSTNSTSDNLQFTTNVSIDGKVVLDTLGVTNGALKIHKTDGTYATITIDNTKDLSEFFTQIREYGLDATIDSNGIISISGAGDVYLESVAGGSNIIDALGLAGVVRNTTVVTSNTNSDKQTDISTGSATGSTKLGDLNGISNYVLEISTDSNAGVVNATVTFSATDTLNDVIDKLAEYGINAFIGADGRVSMNGEDLKDFTIGGGLGEFLMGDYEVTKEYDKVTTNNVSANLLYTVVVNMDDETKLSDLGVTNANGFELEINDVFYTLSISETATIGEFRDLLATYGINSEIINGKLSLSADGIVRLRDKSGTDVITDLGLGNMTGGNVGQESTLLGDIETYDLPATMQTRIADLTDSVGNSLGITNGEIYVYQDGTRHLVNINTDDTLETLASKLSQYGITMGIAQNGQIYFDGNNNSYLTTDGLTSATSSNILQKLNIETWETRYNSKSEVLDHEVENDVGVSGDTKLVELRNADGDMLGITTGEYTVYSNGVRTTETITEDTTVDDFIATMATYGMIAEVDSSGQINVGAYNNTYLATAANAGANTNAIDILFEEWNFVNIYTSNNLEIPEDVTVAISKTTKLADINRDANGDGINDYEDGYITVVHNGVQTNISLTADDTVGTLMDELALYGFDCVINDSGQLIVKNTGNSILQNYSGTDKASNVLDILGIGLGNWITTNLYTGEAIDVIKETDKNAAADRDTKLSKLGITTGEYNIYSNGVKYTALISSDETVGSFLDTLATFGIQANIVDNGTFSVLQLQGNGDSYIAETASTVNQSNVVDVLFPTALGDSIYNYSADLQTSTLVTTFTAATEDTLLRDLDVTWGNETLKAQGILSVTVDGETSYISIGADETVGTLLSKFRTLGLEASINNGELLIQSGHSVFTINSDGTTSSLLPNLALAYHDDLGGYAASDDIVEQTVTWDELVNKSVAQYADENTVMSMLNISSGTLSVYKNGQKATIQIDKDETFGVLQSRVATALSGVVVEVDDDGYLTFSSTNGDSVEVGSTTDTSNFSAICGLTNDKSGTVKSARQLYRVNGDSVVTTSELFRRADVTEGTFIIGNATFTIDNTTTLSNIISQINASDDANATAQWDSIDGKLVITSRTTGSAFINIEAGTSNFTDVMGLTKTEIDAVSGDQITRILVDAQEIGDNAQFSINGTYFTSTSNTITSDLSRIQGLTINLKGVTGEGGSTTLTVERDKETLANAVSDIVDAYNELIENVDKEVARGAQLADQSTLKMIRNQIRSLMTSSLSGMSVFKNLDSIGISADKASANNIATDKVNVLNFDKDRFLSAFDADRTALKQLLVGTDTNLGVFSRIENVLESALTGVNGYFDSANRSYQNEISRLDKKIEKANKDVERYKARLEAKFSAMDLLIAKMQNQYSSFLG